MEENFDEPIGNIRDIFYKNYFTSCFYLLLLMTSSIGIYMFGKTIFDAMVVYALNGLWFIILVGVYAYYKSKDEQRFLILKEHYVNIKMIRG